MARWLQLGLIATLGALSRPSHAAGLPPWELGMSRAQVTNFVDFGPYKTFTNGDLETFNGIFDGQKENVQFFFNDSGLHRIGVYLYEGTDLTAAASKWKECHETLARLYGSVETPGMTATAPTSTAALEEMASKAIARVTGGDRVQMAPERQPDKVFIYSSFWRSTDQGTDYYFLTIFFDPPHP